MQNIFMLPEAAKEIEVLTQLLAGTAIGVHLLNPQDIIIWANRHELERLGYRDEEYIGHRISEFYSDPQGTIDMLDELTGKECLCPYPVGLKCKDGEIKYVNIDANRRNDQAGQIIYTRCFSHDVSKQKKLEEQLRQSQKMKALGTLAGGIAHDFNNILSAIMGNVELCLSGLAENSAEKKYLDNIYKSGERAVQLIRQIMTFSRMDPSCFKPLDLALVIQQALEILRATIPANIEIQQSWPQNCPAVSADETQIHQIILNLCTNAYDAMGEEGGLLEISLSEVRQSEPAMGILAADGYVKLTVKDSGQGIEPMLKEHIFDPFFTNKGIHEGTGLGLSVVHGIVKKHQGKIHFDSELGQGTSFYIFLPTIKSTMGIAAAPVQMLTEKAGTGHILIVEDEEELINLYQAFLLGQGYEVTVCRDGVEALALFKVNPRKFDLVLTDHAMPNMTGKQLAPALLKCRADIPIIMLTGYSDLMSEEEAKALKISKYLIKPLTLSLLQQQINNCLRACPRTN